MGKIYVIGSNYDKFLQDTNIKLKLRYHTLVCKAIEGLNMRVLDLDTQLKNESFKSKYALCGWCQEMQNCHDYTILDKCEKLIRGVHGSFTVDIAGNSLTIKDNRGYTYYADCMITVSDTESMMCISPNV